VIEKFQLPYLATEIFSIAHCGRVLKTNMTFHFCVDLDKKVEIDVVKKFATIFTTIV
jgi:hypothetical protein